MLMTRMGGSSFGDKKDGRDKLWGKEDGTDASNFPFSGRSLFVLIVLTILVN